MSAFDPKRTSPTALSRTVKLALFTACVTTIHLARNSGALIVSASLLTFELVSFGCGARNDLAKCQRTRGQYGMFCDPQHVRYSLSVNIPVHTTSSGARVQAVAMLVSICTVLCPI